LVGRASASASSSVDFVLPQYVSTARSRYRLDFRQVQAATDGALVLTRNDDAGGASFDDGGTDYVNSIGIVSGASSWTAVEGTWSGIQLSADMDTGVAAHCLTGFVEINPGAAGARYPMVVGESISRGNGASYAGWQRLVISGVRGAAYDCNAIRLIFSAGNISLGDFVLSAAYD